MSSASYAAWAKFDVEKELERVDEAEQHEQQQKRQLKQVQAKESVESSAVQAAQQSADVLAAQAAVAALKAKKRVRKGRKARGSNDGGAVVDAEAEAEKARTLQAQAALFARKQALLRQIMENRRRGEAIVRTNKKTWSEAKQCFEVALSAVKALEALAPELLKAEQENVLLKSGEQSAAVSNQQEVTHEHQHHDSENGDHQHGDECSHGCSHKKNETAKKPVETLPKANDLLAIIKMFYKDVYMGIGTSDLEEGRLAAASEAFKEVLLRDDMYLAAWIKRGEAFERMKAPLLAMLHFNRVVNVDADNESGKDALERVKAKLLTTGDASSDKTTIKRAVAACTERKTLQQILTQIDLVFEEANVLAGENFYEYSTTKYQIVLSCIEAIRARPELLTSHEDAVVAILRELEISCHMNIASGCLETQRNYAKGLAHCEQVLLMDSKHTVCHFRMGQLYQSMHNYGKALECLATAQSLMSTAPSSDEDKHQMLATIAKEIDKCEFDRNQYDVGYLRTVAASQRKKVH